MNYPPEPFRIKVTEMCYNFQEELWIRKTFLPF